MNSHELMQVVQAADNAINQEDFDTLMDIYAEDATLVVRPGLNVTGKPQIRQAFTAIAEHFNHSLVVKQGDMQIVEGGDTALVLARTLLSATLESGEGFASERLATYVFRKDAEGSWRCAIDNSYGTELVAPESQVTLHLVCGKIGSGKSTLAQRLANGPHTILVSEDVWLSRLYPNEIASVADYARCSEGLRNALTEHISALLAGGASVVLDFPANTLKVRNWARQLFEQAGVHHQLHYLDIPDELCKARLRQRNAAGVHPFMPSDAQFDEISRYFVPPSAEEGFNVTLHR